jgi:hypothetical protein
MPLDPVDEWGCHLIWLVFVVVCLSNWQYVCSSLLSGDHILRLYDLTSCMTDNTMVGCYLLLATNISNSEHNDSWGSLGSPAVTSSPKPKPITYQPTRNSKALRFLCINFQSARKKGKDISALVESVKPDTIMGTETWLSEDVCSSEYFDTSHGRVLLAVKKDLLSLSSV